MIQSSAIVDFEAIWRSISEYPLSRMHLELQIYLKLHNALVWLPSSPTGHYRDHLIFTGCETFHWTGELTCTHKPSNIGTLYAGKWPSPKSIMLRLIYTGMLLGISSSSWHTHGCKLTTSNHEALILHDKLRVNVLYFQKNCLLSNRGFPLSSCVMILKVTK